MGEDPGQSKLDKAAKLNVKNIDEDELFDLIKQKGTDMSSTSKVEEDKAPVSAKKTKAKTSKADPITELKNSPASTFYGKPSTLTVSTSTASSSSTSTSAPSVSKNAFPLSSNSSSNIQKPKISNQSTYVRRFMKSFNLLIENLGSYGPLNTSQKHTKTLWEIRKA